MQTLTLTPTAAQSRTCKLYIGLNILKNLASLCDLTQYSKIFVVTNQTVAPLLLDKILDLAPDADSIVLAAGEQQKNIETVQAIWTAMHAAGCDRHSLVINLGGGVIGDLGGFAASTYMRGVDFINVPTTLLAQVDASVGGKTGFNFDGIKNLIGTVDQPVCIIVDPELLVSQNPREFLSGFAEIIKHGLVSDAAFFEIVVAQPPHDLTHQELADIITHSCEIKLQIVTDDVRETGSRKLLNFGHTVGHAIEALSLKTDAPLLHGEAISIGMVIEANISQRQGLLAESDAKRIEQVFVMDGLPTHIPSTLKLDDMIKKMRSDKKNDHGHLNFTLLQSIGQAVFNQQVDESVVREALASFMDKSP